jgi:hypothetical protein
MIEIGFAQIIHGLEKFIDAHHCLAKVLHDAILTALAGNWRTGKLIES